MTRTRTRATPSPAALLVLSALLGGCVAAGALSAAGVLDRRQTVVREHVSTARGGTLDPAAVYASVDQRD